MLINPAKKKPSGLNIIIVGCGKIGTTILSSLLAEGHDIVAVDSNPDVIS